MESNILLPPPLNCEACLSESYCYKNSQDGFICHPRQLHVPRAPNVHGLYMTSNSPDSENARSLTITQQRFLSVSPRVPMAPEECESLLWKA